MKPVNVGILGLGTVGTGTVKVLARNGDEIARRAGRSINIVQASARTLDKDRDCDLGGIALTTDSNAIVNNPEIDVVVELIGGEQPAKDLVLAALNNGKHVVTANKALIALHGEEIFSAAQANGVMVAFEAAVAGGIPVIKAVREGLAANRVEWLAGIINGTCNYILTEMRTKGREFDDVLAEAQALGYAEADPTFDIGGIDAAHKLTILAATAFGIPLQFDRMIIEGIEDISRADVAHAADLGYEIKHLGIAVRREDGVELRVHPTLVPQDKLLASVNGVMNAVLVQGDAVGQTMYYGAGAGALPTASSVVADLVDVVRTLTTDPSNRVPHLAFQPDQLDNAPILTRGDIETAYYLRMSVADEVGVLAEITRILAVNGISIEAVQQQEPPEGATEASLILLTHRIHEAAMDAAIAQIEALNTTHGSVVRIRMESFATGK